MKTNRIISLLSVLMMCAGSHQLMSMKYIKKLFSPGDTAKKPVQQTEYTGAFKKPTATAKKQKYGLKEHKKGMADVFKQAGIEHKTRGTFEKIKDKTASIPQVIKEKIKGKPEVKVGEVKKDARLEGLADVLKEPKKEVVPEPQVGWRQKITQQLESARLAMKKGAEDVSDLGKAVVQKGYIGAKKLGGQVGTKTASTRAQVQKQLSDAKAAIARKLSGVAGAVKKGAGDVSDLGKAVVQKGYIGAKKLGGQIGTKTAGARAKIQEQISKAKATIESRLSTIQKALQKEIGIQLGEVPSYESKSRKTKEEGASLTNTKQKEVADFQKKAFDELGLKEGATEQEINKAFKKMARTYHPDVSDLPKDVATKKMQDLENARSQLLENAQKQKVQPKSQAKQDVQTKQDSPLGLPKPKPNVVDVQIKQLDKAIDEAVKQNRPDLAADLIKEQQKLRQGGQKTSTKEVKNEEVEKKKEPEKKQQELKTGGQKDQQADVSTKVSQDVVKEKDLETSTAEKPKEKGSEELDKARAIEEQNRLFLEKTAKEKAEKNKKVEEESTKKQEAVAPGKIKNKTQKILDEAKQIDEQLEKAREKGEGAKVVDLMEKKEKIQQEFQKNLSLEQQKTVKKFDDEMKAKDEELAELTEMMADPGQANKGLIAGRMSRLKREKASLLEQKDKALIDLEKDREAPVYKREEPTEDLFKKEDLFEGETKSSQVEVEDYTIFDQ